MFPRFKQQHVKYEGKIPSISFASGIKYLFHTIEISCTVYKKMIILINIYIDMHNIE